MYRTYLSLLLFLSISVFSNLVKGEAQSDAPFLYIYSEEKTAFLIERADGTDTRVLSEYDLPKNHLIGGPGWSPSTKNFAWFSSSVYGPYVEQPSLAFLVHDYHPAVSLLEGLGEISLMEWSPKTDLLLVTRVVTGDTSTTGAMVEVYIFDETARVVLKESYAKKDIDYIEWSPSGDYILVYFQTDSSEENGIYKMQAISMNSRIQEKDFYQQSLFCSLPRWSVNNTAAYYDLEGENLVIESFADEGAKAQISLQSKIPRFVDWSPNGEYALVYTTSTCDEKNAQVWFFSMSSKELEFVADDVELPGLPYIDRLAGADKNVYPSSSWSQDSKYGAFISAKQLVIFNPETSNIQRIDLTASAKGQVYNAKWASNDVVIFDWSENSTTADSIYTYNAMTSEVQQLVFPSEETAPYVNYFSLSADEAYLAYAFLSQCGDACIVNLKNNNQVPVYLQSDLDATLPVDEVIWHPSENWLFVLGEIDLGSGIRLVNVVNASGIVQRDLGICKLGTSCFGWMPSL